MELELKRVAAPPGWRPGRRAGILPGTSGGWSTSGGDPSTGRGAIPCFRFGDAKEGKDPL